MQHMKGVLWSYAQAERDTVSRSEAEAAFQDGNYKHAARLWGRMQGGDPSFEEIALRFVEVGATDALQVFLMARLQVLAPDDKAQVSFDMELETQPAADEKNNPDSLTYNAMFPRTHVKCVLPASTCPLTDVMPLRQEFLWQATMVASWIVELHLDQINRAMLEESSEANSRSEAHTEALRAFLKDHVEILDVNVTISLLASYGRMDDLMHYATYRQVCFSDK